MKKGLKISLIVIALLIIAAVVSFTVIGGASTKPARLVVESDVVQVNGNAVQGEQDLKLNDDIKTVNGEATVILYDSVVVTLEPNSEVTISKLVQDHPGIKQVSGSTWTKFADVVGITTFDVETPTTVATVRGTEFGVDVQGNESSVDVGEGNVDVGADGKVTNVKQFQKLVKKEGLEAALSDLTPEQKQKLLTKMERTLRKMKMHRNRIVFEHKLAGKLIERYAHGDKEKAKQFFEDIDAGRTDDNELMAKIPVKPGIVYKIKKMDDKIKAEQERIATLKQSLGISS